MKVMDLLDSLCCTTKYQIAVIDEETLETLEESSIQEIGRYNCYDEYTAQFFNKKVMGVAIDIDLMIIMVYK